jgi:hypothetical protein
VNGDRPDLGRNVLLVTQPMPASSTVCRLCLKRPADSREHLPGKRAQNSGPVRIRHIQMNEGERGFSHRELRDQDGFALRALCRKCNSKTGSRYGDAYASFVRQFGTSGLVAPPDGREHIVLERVRPARIAKQIASMFIAAQPRAMLPKLDWLRRFVLDRDAVLTAPEGSDDVRIYLYRNDSHLGRIVPVTSIIELFSPGPVEDRSAIFSEVTWPPVGLVLCLRGGPWLEQRGLVDITGWGQRSFDAVEDIRLLVRSFTIASDHALAFGSAGEVERWRAERGVAWALVAPEDLTSPTATSMLWRRDR